MKITQITRSNSDFQQALNHTVLSESLISALPNERIASIQELDGGLFNNTYRVETNQHSYILKVAPSPSAKVFYNERHLMQREATQHLRLKRISNLIPDYVDFFKFDGRQAFLQKYVSGRLWHDVENSLSQQENNILWFQLGKVCKLFHSTKSSYFGYPEPWDGHADWASFILDLVSGMARDCHQYDRFCPEIQTYQSLLPKFYSVLNEVKSASYLHGDIWPRNVIISGSGSNIHIKALIDCERVFFGDPISEWVPLLYGVPDSFWRGYGGNLLANSNPIRIELYKGMYFVMNILESSRFSQPAHKFRKLLSAVNENLRNSK